MKSAEQIKGAVKNIAKKMNLKPQEVLQIFMFERLVERLSISKYKENFILKGGLLIASMIGIAERTTMDMDTTIQGLPMTEEEMEKIIKEILALDVEDGIHFEYQGMQPIREDDEYNNFCVSICAMYGKMKIPMKIDITTGDKITPRQIDYGYKFMFENKSVMVKAYTLETIIAEKYETVIRRNIGNTRARDFYDLFVLVKIKKNEIRWNVLKEAVLATATKRGSLEELTEYKEIIEDMQESQFLKRIWEKYKEENTYSEGIAFADTLDIVLWIGKELEDGQKIAWQKSNECSYSIHSYEKGRYREMEKMESELPTRKHICY